MPPRLAKHESLERVVERSGPDVVLKLVEIPEQLGVNRNLLAGTARSKMERVVRRKGTQLRFDLRALCYEIAAGQVGRRATSGWFPNYATNRRVARPPKSPQADVPLATRWRRKAEYLKADAVTHP